MATFTPRSERSVGTRTVAPSGPAIGETVWLTSALPALSQRVTRYPPPGENSVTSDEPSARTARATSADRRAPAGAQAAGPTAALAVGGASEQASATPPSASPRATAEVDGRRRAVWASISAPSRQGW